MTPETGKQWLEFAMKITSDDLDAISLTDEQITIIAKHLANNKLLNPPKHRPAKTATFRCYRCQRLFFATYRTRHPHLCPTCKN